MKIIDFIFGNCFQSSLQCWSVSYFQALKNYTLKIDRFYEKKILVSSKVKKIVEVKIFQFQKFLF